MHADGIELMESSVIADANKYLPPARIGEGDDFPGQRRGVSEIILELVTAVLAPRNDF